MDSIACGECGNSVPLAWERCPHCGRPGLFPNVRAAQVDSERVALDRRYQEALAAAESRGARGAVEKFEEAVRSSKAVLARPLRELDRLSASDKELFPSYYGMLKGEVRLPHGNVWDGLRGVADEALFPGYKEHIRFAALSLDGLGLVNYGECSFVLREPMIAHRASIFEENSTLSLKEHKYEPPPGYRATWEDRSKLCVAKLANEIGATTLSEHFPRLLLSQGSTAEEDRFVEVHVWGPMTMRTVEKVTVSGLRRRSVRRSLRDRLKGLDVEMEER